MAKVKISKSELVKIIKEEYSKKMTEIKLKNRLRQINEEIEEIMSEDEDLEEVTAGSPKKVRATAWTGEKNGDEKWGADFEKKGSHLVEDEEIEDEVILDDETNETDDDLNIDDILAQLASALETKIEDTVDEKIGNSDEEGNMNDVEGDEDLEIQISDEETPDEKPEEEIEVSEEEPIEEQDGSSIAQEQKPKNAVPFDNGAAKIPSNDERDKGGIVSEGTKKRMQILSGIKPNDFHNQ